ncbi:hypothetical protein [Streptomyces himastatinicus]|uniref:hypothetical protein n=1 Tax=Streptomyces himastatinicus TaxID=998084 RepID=UPI0012B68F18|nr:hypothetical protein [Streptomyces himastatinicus]
MSGPVEGFDKAAIAARGPVSGITIHAHMRSGPHAIVDYPIDLVVVTELSFQLAERARTGPGEHPPAVTPQSVLERLREMGVKSGNGSRLIGRDAVYESFARLRAKGYLRRIIHRADNKVSGVSYEYYEFPAWNPEPPILEGDNGTSPQVGAASGNAGSGNAGTRSGKRTKSRSPQVKPTSGNAGSGNAGSSTSPQVGAASGNAGSPPLPPGGGTTPPPTPSTDGARQHPPQTEEEGVFDQKDLDAAVAFLQSLPDPWFVGDKDAAHIAPELLAQMARKEWPCIHEVDHSLLASCLATNPGGANNLVSILRAKRIPNLRAYSRAAARRAAGGRTKPEPGMCARHPNFREDDCSPCRIAERERLQRGKSDPGPVDGPGLLARLRAGKSAN